MFFCWDYKYFEFKINLLKKIFIRIQLLYNIAYISIVQQSESLYKYTYPPLLWISFPFRSPQSTEQNSLSYMVDSYQLHILYMVLREYICQPQSLNSFPLPCYLLASVSNPLFSEAEEGQQIILSPFLGNQQRLSFVLSFLQVERWR